MKRTLIWCVVYLSMLGVTTDFVAAATLYIDPPQRELYRGDAMELNVRLDTDEAAGECVNAVDAVITYTDSIVPVDISIGDSILSMWVERPVINQAERTITFAGGIPNGYCGRVEGDPRLTNTLATIIVRSPGFSIGGAGSQQDTATVQFAEATTAYLNDGQGTKATLQTYGATLTLSPNAGPGIVDPWRDEVTADVIPPEEFSIAINRDDRAFTGRYFISFNTTDKQTGIDSYQVMEDPISEIGSFNWGRADAPWITTRSPYVLEDQTLNSIIRVKAIDKAGNEYIATLVPDETLSTMSHASIVTYAVYAGLIVFALLVLIFGIFAYRAARRKKKQLAAQSGLIATDAGTGTETNHDNHA